MRLISLFWLASTFSTQEGPALTAQTTDAAILVRRGERELLGYQRIRPAESKLSVDSACYFHPLATPKGIVITDVAPDDHKHHRGLFLAWVEMHGRKDADFWGWGQFAPKDKRQIVNREVNNLKGGKKVSFQVKNDWLADGDTILKEDLQASVGVEGEATVLDLTYTLTADADLTISKWAFSGFCLRMRKDGKAEVHGPDGLVHLAAPNHMKPETDWPAAPWYGYSLTLPDGSMVGGAVIDHPKNPPSLWHNAASIRMLNPAIMAPKEVVIKAGEPLLLKYRVVAHDGPTPKEQINRLAGDWAR